MHIINLNFKQHVHIKIHTFFPPDPSFLTHIKQILTQTNKKMYSIRMYSVAYYLTTPFKQAKSKNKNKKTNKSNQFVINNLRTNVKNKA